MAPLIIETAKTFTVLMLATAFIFGCQKSQSTSQSSVVNNNVLSKSKVTFSEHILPLLNAKCVTCHTTIFYDPVPENGCSGMISFEDRLLGAVHPEGHSIGEPTGCPDVDLYDRLTKLKSWTCYTIPYVTPNDLSKSLLFIKLRGGQCPTGNVVTPAKVHVSDDEVELIRKWILTGAVK